MEDRIDLNGTMATDYVRSANSCPVLPHSTVPTPPAARFQIQPARTGRDSGYGTDYSPSPSSNTSSRIFVFNNDINTSSDACCRIITPTCDTTATTCSLVLPEGLDNVHFDLSDCESVDVFVNSDDEGKSDNAVEDWDENDVEVDIINSKKCAGGSAAIPQAVDIHRPCAPHPVEGSSERDVDTNVGSQCVEDSNTVISPVVPLPNTGGGDSHINSRLAHPQTCIARDSCCRLRAPCGSAENHREISVARGRSHSLPDVQTLHENSCAREIGRQLRRLSDDFFYYHCCRRRGHTLSVESPPFPLRVNINVYTGRLFPDRRTYHDGDDQDDTDT